MTHPLDSAFEIDSDLDADIYETLPLSSDEDILSDIAVRQTPQQPEPSCSNATRQNDIRVRNANSNENDSIELENNLMEDDDLLSISDHEENLNDSQNSEVSESNSSEDDSDSSDPDFTINDNVQNVDGPHRIKGRDRRARENFYSYLNSDIEKNIQKEFKKFNAKKRKGRRKKKSAIAKPKPKKRRKLAILKPKLFQNHISDNGNFNDFKLAIKDCLSIPISLGSEAEKIEEGNLNYLLGQFSVEIDQDLFSFDFNSIADYFPGISTFKLFISDCHLINSWVDLETKKDLSEEESALLPLPPKTKKADVKRRKIFFTEVKHFFYICKISAEIFRIIRGLKNSQIFMTRFVSFDESTKLMSFNVFLRDKSVAQSMEDISIPSRSNEVKSTFNHFLQIEPTTYTQASCIDLDSDLVEENKRKGKEDIAWFYGQIKKYHDREFLPNAKQLQPKGLVPILRDYQKRAVRWMLYRENSLEILPSSEKMNLNEAFLQIMYTPIHLQTENGEMCNLFFNPFFNYVSKCRLDLPSLPTGGILADEMGLGKTVEVLSLILLNQRPGFSHCEFIDEDDFFMEIEEQEDVTLKIKKEEYLSNGDSDESDEEYVPEKEMRKRKSSVSSGEEAYISPRKRSKRSSSPCEFFVGRKDSEEKPTIRTRAKSNGKGRGKKVSFHLDGGDDSDSNEDAPVLFEMLEPVAKRRRKAAAPKKKEGNQSTNVLFIPKEIIPIETNEIKVEAVPSTSTNSVELSSEMLIRSLKGKTSAKKPPQKRQTKPKGAAKKTPAKRTNKKKETTKAKAEVIANANRTNGNAKGPKKPTRKKEEPEYDQNGKRITMFDRVKAGIYDAALSEYSAAGHEGIKFHGEFFNTELQQRSFFECVCGNGYSRREKIVTCRVCSSSQHASCVRFEKFHGLTLKKENYLCPHCWVNEVPVEAKTTLIITPNTISYQWIREIQRHVRAKELKILFYKGVSKQGFFPPTHLAQYDIVITTYTILAEEINYIDLPHMNSEKGRRFRNPKRFLSIPSPLPSVNWWRICLDEAQMVEGISTKMSSMALRLKAVHRWCVTGTPVNKNLEDLFGLFAFLGIQPICEDIWWKILVSEPFYRREVSLLYELFGQLIWRTGKPDVLDQLGIPPQTEITHWLNFSPIETHFYKRQYDVSAAKIREKISLLGLDLDMKLSEVDRKVLNSLLQPFLELRMACCHPQMVRGHVVRMVNKKNTTLTMEEILEQLIKKTSLQCTDDHRLIVSALNGLAGLLLLNDDYVAAASNYREAIQSSDKYHERFKTDSLQILHSVQNLLEIFEKNKDNNEIPRTLSDDELLPRVGKIKDDYLKNFSNGVNFSRSSLQPLTEVVEDLRHKFGRPKVSWWSTVLLKTDSDTSRILLARIKDNLALNYNKGKHKFIGTLANRFNCIVGLQQALIENLLKIDDLRSDVLESIEDLQSKDPFTFVDSAVLCHLRRTDVGYQSKFDAGFQPHEYQCLICAYHDKFLELERVLFTHQTNEKISRTGRNRYKNNLFKGDVDVTKDDELAALTKEQHELVENTEHVNIGMAAEKARGTWGPSDTERTISILSFYSKSLKCSSNVVEDGSNHLKLFEAMRKEFKQMRILWKNIFDQVSAYDELSQATTRLRLRYENEDAPEENISIKKHVKVLSSGIMEKTLKIQNIHVLEKHEIGQKMSQMKSDCITGRESLSLHLGQLIFLETLKKNNYGMKGSFNQENCPVCVSPLGHKWCVLLCGHSFCTSCVKTIGKNSNRTFPCPLCRIIISFSEISYVDSTERVEENTEVNVKSSIKDVSFENEILKEDKVIENDIKEEPEKIMETPEPQPGPSSNCTNEIVGPSKEVNSNEILEREILGSHSTKVEAIVQMLFRLNRTHPGEKVIVFSMWIEVLDIISRAMDQNDISYCKVKASGKEFQEQLDIFKKSKTVFTLLMPIASGSKGLNIIEATHVLLVEPILNSASELQAIGRVHRIGQNRPTFVHRFYVKDTIEEQLFTLLKNSDISSSDEGSLTVGDLKTMITR